MSFINDATPAICGTAIDEPIRPAMLGVIKLSSIEAYVLTTTPALENFSFVLLYLPEAGITKTPIFRGALIASNKIREAESPPKLKLMMPAGGKGLF